jgi:bacterioferritin
LIKESIEEMRHADHLIERILFLDGLPNLQHLGKLHIGENVPEMLQGDLDLELAGVQDLRAAIAHSEGIADYISRDLFKNILHDEEEHIDWLETQFSLIRDIGAER